MTETNERIVMYAVIALPGGNLLKPVAYGPFSAPRDAYAWAVENNIENNWVVSELYIPGLD